MLKDPTPDTPLVEPDGRTREDTVAKQGERTESEIESEIESEKRAGTTSPTIQHNARPQDIVSEELPSFDADQITEILSRGGDLTGSLVLGENPDDVSLGPSLISFADEHPISRAHSSLMSSFLTEPGISMVSTMKGDDVNSQALNTGIELNSFGTSLVSFADDGVDSFGASLVSFAEVDSSDEGSEGANSHIVQNTSSSNIYGKEKKAVSFAESEYREMNSSTVKQIPRTELEKSRTEDLLGDASYGVPDNDNISEINPTKTNTMRKNSINRNISFKTEPSTDVAEEKCIHDKVDAPTGAEHNARDIIVGCTSNVSQYTTASHATTPRSNASYFLGTESEELAERCDTVSNMNSRANLGALQADLIMGCDTASNINSGAKFRALQAITDAFDSDRILESQVQLEKEKHDMPGAQLETDEMDVTKIEKVHGVASDGVDPDTKDIKRENPFEDSPVLVDMKSLPTCANHTEDSAAWSHLFPVKSQNSTDEQVVCQMKRQPTEGEDALVVEATRDEIWEIKSLFTESTEDHEVSFSASSSTCSSILPSKAKHPAVTKPRETEDGDYNLKRLIIFSVITLFGGFYGSFYAETSCHFATISQYVGYYGSDFKSHVGMWQYSPIDSIFTGSSYCASYGNSETLTSPSSVRIAGLLALLCGTFTMIIIWCYLFFVRTTEFLWGLAWHMALIAGLLQACTLLFFFESVCQNNTCGIGPGSVASIIASLSWFFIAFGMTRTVPSDAIIKPIGDFSIFKHPGAATVVELRPISRSDAGRVNPRTSMYQAPVFTDDYALV